MKRVIQVLFVTVLISCCIFQTGCFKRSHEANPLGPDLAKKPTIEERETLTGLPTQINTFIGGWHRAITAIAFYQAWEAKKISLSLPENVSLKSAILLEIQNANDGQDRGFLEGIFSGSTPFYDLRRHFNRSPSTTLAAGLSTYTSYLQEETRAFQNHRNISRTLTTASEALKIWGRLSHSWQDFFSHAVKEGGDLTLWTANPAINETPDTITHARPSSYPGEHSLVFDDLSGLVSHATLPERLARVNAASAFCRSKFEGFLETWWQNYKDIIVPPVPVPPPPPGQT